MPKKFLLEHNRGAARYPHNMKIVPNDGKEAAPSSKVHSGKTSIRSQDNNKYHDGHQNNHDSHQNSHDHHQKSRLRSALAVRMRRVALKDVTTEASENVLANCDDRSTVKTNEDNLADHHIGRTGSDVNVHARSEAWDAVHRVTNSGGDFNGLATDHETDIRQENVRNSLTSGGRKQSNGELPSDQLWQLQQVTDRRVKVAVSEGMSPEAQLAMELARAEVELSRKLERKARHSVSEKDIVGGRRKVKVKKTKALGFVEVYESSSVSRLSGDILDENSSEGNQRRWALGGGNVNVAMETVEIVSHGGTSSDSAADDFAIEETARLNSVEKCLVWMEVHEMNE